jgi:threonine dehydratase
MEPLSTLPVSSVDIDAAARVLAPFAVRTPLLSSPALDERAGTKVFLKPEMLQRTGSHLPRHRRQTRRDAGAPL